LLPASAQLLRGLGAEYLHLRYALSEPPPERTQVFSRNVRSFHPRRVVK
jgi:hypothetical protein